MAVADYGQRVIAYLIDLAILFGVVFLGVVLGVVSDVLGGIVLVVGYLGWFIYNLFYLQGTTGQTIGKKQQGIKLVRDDSGQPVGAGMAFVRYLVIWLFSVFSCGLYGLLDILWPLWDDDKKRLTDKMLKFAVVRG